MGISIEICYANIETVRSNMDSWWFLDNFRLMIDHLQKLIAYLGEIPPKL